MLLPALKWKGHGSIVDVAARYMMDSSGFEPQWRQGFFFTPIQSSAGAHPATWPMGASSPSGVEWPGHGIDHLPSSSCEVKHG